MTNITLYQEIYKQIESETLNIAYHVSLDENQKMFIVHIFQNCS